MGNEKKIKIVLLMLIDIFLINVAYLIGFYARFSFNVEMVYIVKYFELIPLILLLYLVPMYFLKMYTSLWRVAGIDEVIYGILACLLGTCLNFIVMNFIPNRIPNIVTILSGLFIMFFTIGFRLSFRVIRRLKIYSDLMLNKNMENVLLIGAGACSRLLIAEMKKQQPIKYKPIGIIDDNINKVGTYLSGIKVLGTRKSIEKIVEENNIDLIVIAIPSIQGEEKKNIIKLCQDTNKKVKIMPGVYELIGDEINLTKMRDVDLKDLLGRDEIKLDKDGIKEYIHNKVVLVTGGGGSIGSELCRQIAGFSPKLLLVLDIYENNAYDLQNELNRKFPKINKHVLIASVRDKKRMDGIFAEYRPDVVFHAAAHKHVPLMEFNPSEAIKNNVVGTLNTAECANKYGVKRFVLISTDKAVNPTNVMGATKRICEMIIQGINKESKTEYVAVRFGNVLGSNGSVIPLFKKQISEGGPLTLTNKYITRYFMLIPEAAQLVLQAGAYAKGGEIFVLDMGEPVKIYDLAKDLIKLSGFEPGKDIKIEITGLRPGEKLYEELLMDEEGLKETGHKKIFIGRPSDFKFKKVKEDIHELLELAKHGNKELIKSKVEDVVPTYKRLDNIKVNDIEEEAVITIN